MTRLVRARVLPRLEEALRKRLARFFLDERRRLSPGIGSAIAPIVTRELEARTKARDAALLDRIEVVLRTLSWDVEARILRIILRPAYAVLTDQALAAVVSELSLETSLDLSARYLRSVESTLASRIVAINDRSRTLIAGRVVDGIEKGLSVRDIVLGVGPGLSDGKGGTKPVFDGIRGLVDSWASTGTGRILGPVGSSSDRQARRVPPLRSTRAFLIAQTESGNGFNRAAIAGYRASGLVDFVEVFDGPSCGWLSHDDPELAHGSIRTLDDAEKHVLSHPRCQRAFGAALAAEGPKASPYQGRDPSDVPGATPG